jgi:hypothetical protein
LLVLLYCCMNVRLVFIIEAMIRNLKSELSALRALLSEFKFFFLKKMTVMLFLPYYFSTMNLRKMYTWLNSC